MTAESLRGSVLIGGGAVAVSVGTHLPWVRVNPDLSPDAAIPMVYLPGMNAGFEVFDWGVLGVTGVVLLVHHLGSREWLRSVTAVLMGVVTTLACAYYLSISSFIGFTALYVPAFGWYLVVLAGLLFSVAGGRRFPSVIRRFRPADGIEGR